MKQLIGRQHSFYIDYDTGILTIEDHEQIIEIPIGKITKITPVTWDEKTETLEDVSKKQPETEVVFDSSVDLKSKIV